MTSSLFTGSLLITLAPHSPKPSDSTGGGVYFFSPFIITHSTVVTFLPSSSHHMPAAMFPSLILLTVCLVSPIVYSDDLSKVQDILSQMAGHYYTYHDGQADQMGPIEVHPEDEDVYVVPRTVLRDEEHLPYNSLWGHQYMAGGAGEGRQFLGPAGNIPNQHQVKSDSMLPAYCDPPNPCPEGYTAADGCVENVPNTAEFSRDYQAQQNCPCDPEHMFDCNAMAGNAINNIPVDGAHATVRGKKFSEKKSFNGYVDSLNARHPRSVDAVSDSDSQHQHHPAGKVNPYLQEMSDIETPTSLYTALTSPISKTFQESRKNLGLARGFSLDVIQDFMMPPHEQRMRRNSESANKTMEIERQNLVSLTQLIIRDVIENAMPLDRTVSGSFQPLQHLFSVLEQIFKHGYRVKPKGLLPTRTKDVWNILESLETVCPQSKEVTESCRNLTQIETNLGRVRAWIRLSLMQKKLPDYFKALVDHRESLLTENYDPGALLMCEESSVVAGLLVGLNFIDYNLCVKDEDLDATYQIISLLPYLKTRSQPESEAPQNDTDGGLKAILDQKNYLEELNSNLKLKVANMEARIEQLTVSNTQLTTSLEESKQQALAVQLENSDLKAVHEMKHRSITDDISAERDTYNQSRQGLDSLNSTLQAKLEREQATKLDMERDLKLQTNIRQETESAMKVMERDLADKENLLNASKKQLDDLKLINLEMYQKLQTAEAALKHKSGLVSRMEQKMQQMGGTMVQLGGKIQILEDERRLAEETARKLSMQLAETDQTRSALETDLRIEQEQKADLIGSLTEQENKLSSLQSEVTSIRGISQSYEKLKNEHAHFQRMSEEQEETLAELGSHLSEQKEKVAELQNLTSQFDPTTQQWEKDASNCKQCEKPFTIARRKHHCRHCGGTFCDPCSDNKMTLPSSPKPVRVCDSCHILLLRRYSMNK